MNIRIPVDTLFILQTLQKKGYEAYIVGGAVRDLLRAGTTETVTDYDFTTNATPEQILALFPESFYENAFGTVSIAPKHLHEMMGLQTEENIENQKNENEKSAATEIISTKKTIELDTVTKIHVSLAEQLDSKFNSKKESAVTQNEKPYEITTYRSDGAYLDHRRPTAVTWGQTLTEDLSRRDFTMNAMAIGVRANVAYDLSQKFLTLTPDDYTIIDPFQGLNDIAQHLIRTVGDPAKRFEEDALRMLRAIRFSVQLNMKMTDEIFTAISALNENIKHISWERIRDEFIKMLQSNFPAEAIELLEETGLLHFLLPEIREGKGVEQAGHHTTDVWTHSIDALRNCPSPDPVVRFATLLHDVAKPRTYRNTDGKITFYNHEIIGARIAKRIAERFRLSQHDCNRMFALVRYHMFHYQEHNTDAAIRRFMRKVGLTNLNDILDLREGDRLGSGARKTSWRLEEMKARMIEQLHQPFDTNDLAIDGHDLINDLGLKPGPMIGKILNDLLEMVLEKPELNQKEKLLEEAKKILTAEKN